MNLDQLNLIIITPHGRSGSLFLQSLLDGHSQMISIPDISLTYNFELTNLDVNHIADTFIAKYPAIFNSALGYLGVLQTNVTRLFGEFGDTHLSKDSTKFRSLLIQELLEAKNQSTGEISRKLFWIAVHRAYARLLNRNPDTLKYIVFHEHGYGGAHNLAIQDFPNLFFVAMTRDPREDWLSWQKVLSIREGRKLSLTRKYHRYICTSEYSRFIMELVQFAQIIKPKNLIVVDLNRFHSLNSQAMKILAESFAIHFESTLLHSTLDGQKWYGNAADRKPISGFDISKSQFGWNLGLKNPEILHIESLLRKEMEILGYKSKFKTQKNEFSYPYMSAFFSFLFVSLSSPRSTSKYLNALPALVQHALRMGMTIFRFPKKVFTDLRSLQSLKSVRDLSEFSISNTSFL